MAGGLMQLIAYGAQDIYLTGNPQITFFKVVYRRHTNFAMEAIEHQFVGAVGFGNRVVAKVTRNGDLAARMYLRVTLPSVDPGNSSFAWVRRLGHAIVSEVQVEIGGTRMDKQYGTWLDIWYELARKGDHEIGYAKMIGDVPELTEYNTEVKDSYILYVPLQFWFNKYIGLSIPLIALQYHQMNIILELAPVETLVVRDCNFDPLTVVLDDVTLLIDYVFLDTDERKRFAQVGHEYLIEQLQFNGAETVATAGETRYRLDYNFPTKELFWAMKNGNYVTGKSFVYYTHEDTWDLTQASCNIVLKSVALDNDPTDIVGGSWIEVLDNSITTVGTFVIINQYSGNVYINPTSLVIGDYGITDKINADITIDNTGNITCTNITTQLTIRDISIPVELMTDTRFNVCDPIVYQYNNYGLMIDGSINPVQDSILKLNGHERFDRREGAYFNYVEPEKHHTNTPADGINVYSFSLYPEEHQPSGTANLSRIDRTDLFITFADSTASPELPDLNLFTVDNQLFLYGVNYNIMRIMSGLAGLAYSVGATG